MGAGGAVGVVFFFFGAAMNEPQNVEDHHTIADGLGEFMHVWLAYCAILALFPGVIVLLVCGAVGSLFALVICPWRAAVYLGALIEATKRLVQACSMGVLNDRDT